MSEGRAVVKESGGRKVGVVERRRIWWFPHIPEKPIGHPAKSVMWGAGRMSW